MTKQTAEEKCTLSNEQLIEKAKDWSDKLAESGGEDWTLSVPVNFNHDPDVLIYELCERLEHADSQLKELLEAVKERRVDNSEHDQGVQGWNSAISEIENLIKSRIND